MAYYRILTVLETAVQMQLVLLVRVRGVHFQVHCSALGFTSNLPAFQLRQVAILFHFILTESDCLIQEVYLGKLLTSISLSLAVATVFGQKGRLL